MHNGHQHVRMGEHIWDDTTGLHFNTTLSGKSEGKGALTNGCTIEALADWFSGNLEDAHQSANNVLDISDARVMRAHVDGLSLERCNRTQLMLGDAPHSSGASELRLIFLK